MPKNNPICFEKVMIQKTSLGLKSRETRIWSIGPYLVTCRIRYSNGSCGLCSVLGLFLGGSREARARGPCHKNLFYKSFKFQSF